MERFSDEQEQMAWHLGYPLSQTLFTNVYIEAILMPRPTSVEEADFVRIHNGEKNPMLVVLRAYCLGLLKACSYVNERIKFEHYYEVSSSQHHVCHLQYI
jgi:hypothetical protein